MAGPKPKLVVTTPVTASFPKEISAMSAVSAKSSGSPRSALSYPGVPRSAGAFDGNSTKTPISPPTAYADFLRFMCLNSPLVTGQSATFPASTPSSAASSRVTTPSSAPSTAPSDCACRDRSGFCSHNIKLEPIEEVSIEGRTSKKRRHRDPLPPPPPTSTKSAPLVPPSPFDRPLLSAPASGVIPTFPSLHIPPSPAIGLDSPLTGTTAVSGRSPYSSRSTKSPFDWEAALKARRFEACVKSKLPAVTSSPAAASAAAASTLDSAPTPTSAAPTPITASGKGPKSIRHIREVVTRTVTYTPKKTPKMEPAPKGKRRKIE